MKNGKRNNKRIRVIALLTREEVEFIDKLGLDSLFSTGLKLSRVDIVGSLVSAAKTMGVTGEGVKNKQEFMERIIYVAASQIERRRYPRLKKELMVKFRNMDSLEEYKATTTKDVGLGGFSFGIEGGTQLTVGQVVEISISDLENTDKGVRAIGRIVWMKESDDEGDRDVGVMLTYVQTNNEKNFPKSFIKKDENNLEAEDKGGQNGTN